ncbi:MAG: hypothetical protein ACFE7R_02665, partial [Candidatus Hodarchaeota archaeon]
IENAALWHLYPSLILNDAKMNQYIIWEGDRVIITLEITNRVGQIVGGVFLTAWLNGTSVSVVDMGSGIFRITLDEDWTRGGVGIYNLQINAQKSGYDSLALELEGFMQIRGFPWSAFFIVGGIFGSILVGSFLWRRRRGDSHSLRRGDNGKSKAERERQRKRDERIDPKELFGV